MSKLVKLSFAALLLSTSVVAAEGFGLGREALPDEIAAWDIDIRPDGQGLPDGQGSVEDGEVVYSEQCAVCHGDFGEAVGRWPALSGGWDTLDSGDPVKTVGSYWPYLSTVYDYVHRAMPFGNAQSLSDDDVYAITAYILYLNDLVEDDFVLSKESFAEVEMPNADGFFMDDRPDFTVLEGGAEPCMENCTGGPVKVTMRARVLDVTPDSGDEVEVETDEGEELVVESDVEIIDAELAEAGEKVFKKCTACHQLGEGAKNRTGPVLNGIVGAEAAQVEGFRYSKALQKAALDGLVWNPEELGWYLEKPRKYIKGTKMAFGGLRKEADRDAVIEYLRQFGAE